MCRHCMNAQSLLSVLFMIDRLNNEDLVTSGTSSTRCKLLKMRDQSTQYETIRIRFTLTWKYEVQIEMLSHLRKLNASTSEVQ